MSQLHIRWPKYWSLSFSISPPNEYSELISFRIEWFDLLAAQGTLKNLLQHHISKAWILRCSAFFIAQLSQESFKEAAFELSFEELFIRLAHREIGGNYMCVTLLGTLSKNSLQSLPDNPFGYMTALSTCSPSTRYSLEQHLLYLHLIN